MQVEVGVQHQEEGVSPQDTQKDLVRFPGVQATPPLSVLKEGEGERGTTHPQGTLKTPPDRRMEWGAGLGTTQQQALQTMWTGNQGKSHPSDCSFFVFSKCFVCYMCCAFVVVVVVFCV